MGSTGPACGAAVDETFLNASELTKADLCEVGTPIPATFQGPGPWLWQCKAGTSYVSCSAEQGNAGAIDGVCGTAHGKSYTSAGAVNAAGLCAAGTADPATVNGNGPWTWECV